jgi:1,2-diacylglycerol 3-alpha-glucosyltransferase
MCIRDRVQTSVGFETQGMTVFEAAAVGTPSILCDHNIAAEFDAGTYWLVKDSSIKALASTIRTAVAEIKAGDNRGDKLLGNDELLQSSLTNKAVKLYEHLIKTGGKYTAR